MAEDVEDQLLNEQIAHRLRQTRRALGYSQALMAKLVGLAGANGWNNYEKAKNRIPVDIAAQLCTIAGCDMDWIYRGEFSGVSERLLTKLQKMQDT
jgi:transcriptional regulator with XRE-family HTH domain